MIPSHTVIALWLLLVPAIAWSPLSPPIFGRGGRAGARLQRTMCSAMTTDSEALLDAVANTDRGVDCSDAQRDAIDALIHRCEASWAGNDAFDEANAPLLYRDCEVEEVASNC